MSMEQGRQRAFERFLKAPIFPLPIAALMKSALPATWAAFGEK